MEQRQADRAGLPERGIECVEGRAEREHRGDNADHVVKGIRDGAGRDEAEAYLAHPVLGQRLIDCAGIVAALHDSDPVAVFGHLDAIKLRSSMTLFAAVAPDQPAFQAVIEKYFDGELDEATTSRL